MNLRALDAWITREQPEYPSCACGNGLHYQSNRESGVCDDCTAPEQHVEAALAIDDAAEGFEPADEALFCSSPSLAELDAWGREQLDELHGTVALYAVGGGR